MGNYLEKILEQRNTFSFQEGMRGISLIQGLPIGARFVWRDDKWWHVLVDPTKHQPIWIRVKFSSLNNWDPDLWDPATAGIVLNRVSIHLGSISWFRDNQLVLEDGRIYAGSSRALSIEQSLLPTLAV